MRLLAAKALGKAREPQAVEPLIAALKDPASAVRKAVIRALFEIGDLRAAEPLLACFKDPNRAVRSQAVEYFSAEFAIHVLPRLLALLETDDTPEMRGYVAQAL